MRDKILTFKIATRPTVRARTFVFSDPRSKALLPLIERTAPSEATILITGETGTGKELVARYIHQLSGRDGRPFVAVNCGAFSETLIESELFGHERGAFTGALAAREGWFEAANGGTLFLDEIGDLPPSLQVKLLRVLQEREVVRLGSRRPISLDVRLIVATNVDLYAAVSAGRFREDLYYRLSVVTLPLPPLRERRGDILPLARHFLALYGEKSGKPGVALAPEAEEAVFSHTWPGNIRELENVIQRAVLVAPAAAIEPQHLGLGAAGASRVGAAPAVSVRMPGMARPGSVAGVQGLDELSALVGEFIGQGEPRLLDRLIDAAVREAFDKSNANQVRTARALGVTRNVVRTYLKNAGLIAAN